jgi:hypothetical protein
MRELAFKDNSWQQYEEIIVVQRIDGLIGLND